MSQNTGFVVKVTAKGKEYFYLRQSYRMNNKPLNKSVFSFGNKEKALKNLYDWKKDSSKIPSSLSELGYDRQDVLSWLKQIEKK